MEETGENKPEPGVSSFRKPGKTNQGPGLRDLDRPDKTNPAPEFRVSGNPEEQTRASDSEVSRKLEKTNLGPGVRVSGNPEKQTRARDSEVEKKLKKTNLGQGFRVSGNLEETNPHPGVFAKTQENKPGSEVSSFLEPGKKQTHTRESLFFGAGTNLHAWLMRLQGSLPGLQERPRLRALADALEA